MAETIKVPGIKEPLPKPAVFAGLAVTVVLILVYYRNQKNQSAAAAAGTSANATGLGSGGLLSGDTTGSGTYPWDGTYGNPSDPYSLDTSTGQTYGTEGYYGGFGVQGTNPNPTGQLGGPPFSNNQAWSAYAIQQLTATQSTNPAAITEALGLYLEGRPLTVNQQDIIYSAIAVAGPVPVQGTGGYPPKLRPEPSKGKPGGGKTFADNPVKGLKAAVRRGPTLVNSTVGGGTTAKSLWELEISWQKSDHATGYEMSVTNETKHRTVLPKTTTVHTTYTVRNLPQGDTFRVTVLAKPAEKGATPTMTQVSTR